MSLHIEDLGFHDVSVQTADGGEIRNITKIEFVHDIEAGDYTRAVITVLMPTLTARAMEEQINAVDLDGRKFRLVPIEDEP
jgi:hypothetical protein